MIIDKSLDSYTRLAVTMVMIVILGIGGLSLFMAKTMRDKIHLIEHESRNISLVNTLQAKTNKLIFALQMFILQPEDAYHQRVTGLYEIIDPELHSYMAYEEAAAYPEAQQEVRLLKEIDRKLHEIMAIHEKVRTGEFSPRHLVRLEKYVTSIEELTAEINRLHFAIIDRKIAKSDRRLQIIAALYGGFSLIGLIVFFLLYKLYSRKVVIPIKKLAQATRQLTAGNRDTRMPERYRTEIGLLYHSFNQMADQIQANETRLQNFNRELEAEVQTRTVELESAQQQLLRLERLATLGQIATSVNHEIKTPLNALSLNLQLLKREKNKLISPAGQADSLDELIGLLAGEINRISDILDEFVNYARFAPPQVKPAELNPLVTKVIELLGQKADQGQVGISSDLAPNLPTALLDQNKMIQALINLGMNALAATPPGGKLHFATSSRDGKLELRISDTGSGIAEEDLPRIFDPFFSRKQLGLGFGLAIVQKIIEDHGGEIICQSRLQQGTTFAIRLPASPNSGQAPGKLALNPRAD